jgi:hypothetical protein
MEVQGVGRIWPKNLKGNETMSNYCEVNEAKLNNEQINSLKKELNKSDNSMDYKGFVGGFEILYLLFCQKFADRAEPTAENMILLNEAYKNIKVTSSKILQQ